MKISDLLKKKGGDTYSIGEDMAMTDCLAMLNEKRIGILVVKDGSGNFAGVVSERDVLRAVVKGDRDHAKIQVKQIMKPRAKVYSVQKGEYFEKVMTLMTEKRVRHIPVMDGEKVMGIVSIGDLLKNLLESANNENEQLRRYISGEI